jgi:hypothetical protein
VAGAVAELCSAWTAKGGCPYASSTRPQKKRPPAGGPLKVKTVSCLRRHSALRAERLLLRSRLRLRSECGGE